MARVARSSLALVALLFVALVMVGCGTVAEAPSDVELGVACTGCVHTQGYWKTHSEYGPAGPADPVWDLLLPDGPDTTFFLSGQTFYEVLNTPSKGNPYYILAHQWIAAKLNILAGNTMTEYVEGVFGFYAEGWFIAHAPDDPFWKAERSLVTFKAEVLDEYNSGLRNVPSCD